jgi:hypothetical protein
MRNILSQNSSQAVARDLPYPYLRFADAVRNGEDPNTPLGLPPTPNYFRASGNVDLGSANYSSDIGRFHFEGTIEEHDSVSTNIRWFVAVDDPTGTVYPVALTKLPTCSRQVGNGTNISYVCTPQNFAIDLDVSVSNYVPQDYQGWPTFYVTAMVEDRDGDDNVVALNPVVFSDGSTAVKVDTIAQ